MQTKATCTASLLASIGLLVSTPSTIGTTGARDPALERDARALVRTTARVHRAIDRWRARGNPSPGRPPLTVELAALVQQRLVIRLTAEPRRAEAVLAWVRGPLCPHGVATVPPSWAGALGPMQFLPSTWRAYGLGGNVHDPRDAILGAANYLRASGAPRDYRRALYAYNPSSSYVEAVVRYAEGMRRDRRAFYAYYSWQVFVRTPSGLRRLTGPGLR